MQRDSVVIYRSFVQAANRLSKKEKLKFYEAIFNYALDGQEPEEDGPFMAVFLMAKPIVDTNNRKFENGKKGGRPKKTKPKPNHNQDETKPKPYEDEDVDEDVDEDEEGEGHALAPAPCTLEELKAFAKEIRSRSDPERFYAYYSARNWIIDDVDVTDWRNLFRIWSARGDHATMFDFPQRNEPVDISTLAARPGNLI